jgi:uncharacterized protein (DUF736 family)
MNKPLSFSLFKNDKKTGNQPDYRSPLKGVITITEPGEYKVAGWKKETKDGQPYLSCVLERVDPGAASRAQNVAQIQATRQALEAGQTPPPPNAIPFRQAPASGGHTTYTSGYQPTPGPMPSTHTGVPYRPTTKKPPVDDQELPF